MCVICQTDDATDVEALPDRRVMALHARRHLEELLAANEAKIHPDPVCKDCGYLYHPAESGELFRDRCSSCEANVVEDLVFDVAFARGRKARRKAVRRLVRKVRRAAKSK